MTEYPGYKFTIYAQLIDREAFEDELAELCEKHTYRGDDVGRWMIGGSIEPVDGVEQ